MAFSDIMNKIRQIDNLAARWMMRHFYILFFQIVLVAIFIIWFMTTLRIIDITTQAPPTTATEKLLSIQSISMSTIVLLMILNSFWMLFMFNGINRLRTLLKDISYNIGRIKTTPRPFGRNKRSGPYMPSNSSHA